MEHSDTLVEPSHFLVNFLGAALARHSMLLPCRVPHHCKNRTKFYNWQCTTLHDAPGLLRATVAMHALHLLPKMQPHLSLRCHAKTPSFYNKYTNPWRLLCKPGFETKKPPANSAFAMHFAIHLVKLHVLKFPTGHRGPCHANGGRWLPAVADGCERKTRPLQTQSNLYEW